MIVEITFRNQETNNNNNTIQLMIYHKQTIIKQSDSYVYNIVQHYVINWIVDCNRR